MQKMFPERKFVYWPLEPSSLSENDLLEVPVMDQPLLKELFGANLTSLDQYVARANGDLVEVATRLRSDLVSFTKTL